MFKRDIVVWKWLLDDHGNLIVLERKVMKVLKEDKDFNQQSLESPVEGLLVGEAVLCRKTSAADCKIEGPELYDRHLRR